MVKPVEGGGRVGKSPAAGVLKLQRPDVRWRDLTPGTSLRDQVWIGIVGVVSGAVRLEARRVASGERPASRAAEVVGVRGWCR